jgi:hypothetical protein
MGLYDRDYMRDRTPAGDEGIQGFRPGSRKRMFIVIGLILAVAGLVTFLLTNTP